MGALVTLDSAVSFVQNYPVLSGVDLEINSGDVTVLAGANGAGKTSLLKLISGLIPLSNGTGRVLGLDLKSQAKEIRAQVGYLSHQTRFYDDLSVWQNVEFFLRIYTVEKKELKNKIPEALEKVGLAPKLHKISARKLSFGQKRRLSLVPLLIRRPALLLLDEPHAGLDFNARRLIDDIILEIAKHNGAVVLASHESEIVNKIATGVYTMAGGMIIKRGI
jgi:heme ABC exporter ATP-binding subunit CcmA